MAMINSRALKFTLIIVVLLSGILFQKIELVSPASGFIDGKNNTLQVKSHSTGNVSKVYVSSGQKVERGSPLISFDNHDAIFNSLSLTKNSENLSKQISRTSLDICVSRTLLQALSLEDAQLVDAVMDSCFDEEDPLKEEFMGVVKNYQWKVKDYFSYKESVEKLISSKQDEIAMVKDSISLGKVKVARLQRHNAPQLQIDDAEKELIALRQGLNKSESETTKLKIDMSAKKSLLFNELTDRLTRSKDDLYEIKDELALNENELSLAKLKLERSTIHSPIAGVILSLEENVGEDYYLEESEPIMLLQKDKAEVVVSAKFDTKFRQNLSVGMEVKIRPSMAGVKGTFSGKVSRISEDSFEDERNNDETRYYKVTIEPVDEIDLSEGTEVRVFAVGTEVTVFDYIKSVLIKNKTVFEPY